MIYFYVLSWYEIFEIYSYMAVTESKLKKRLLILSQRDQKWFFL